MKKNFMIDAPVVIKHVGIGEILEGATGTIVGKAFGDAVVDFYIVLLDKPLAHAKAVVMIESCLFADGSVTQ